MPAIASPAPLSPYPAYTSWPGGVDPMAALYRGGRRRRTQRQRHRAAHRRGASRRLKNKK